MGILRLTVVGMLMLLSSMAWAQTRTVSGKVTSIQEGTAIPGVNVVVKGTTNGTTTDSDGKFTIDIGQSTGGTLVFSFIGFTTQEQQIGERTIIDVQLTADITQLSEVIVTAYGTETKKSFTGSAVSVNSETISKQPFRGLDQALQGTAAGVQVTQNSGTPGSGIAVRVRGSSSIAAGNEPLYVVDGIPINTGSYSQIGVGNQQTNALADINPNDIASLEVLKDAAASALYGSRASNGVVLITTKRGKTGGAKVTFNYYGGVQQAWKEFHPLTGPQFVDLLSDALVGRYGIGSGSNGSPEGVANADGTVSTFISNTARTWSDKYNLASYFWSSNPALTTTGGITSVAPSGTPLEVNDASFYLDPTKTPSTNWWNQVVRPAPIQNADFNLSGGTDNVKYFSSFGYFKQGGIIRGSGFERYSGRMNLDLTASKKLNFKLTNLFSRSVNNRINNDNNIFGVLSTAILNAPDFVVKKSDGTYARDPRNSIDNPVAQALEPTNLAASTRLNSNVKGTYEILPNLSVSSSIGIDFLYFKEDRFIPTTTAQGLSTNGRGDANNQQEINWLNENLLTYQKNFGDHNFSILGGATYQESKQTGVTAEATSFPGNSLKVLSAGSVKVDASTTASSWSLVSYLGRFNYDFKGKYFFNASLRTDKSSRFANGQRVGYFPAVSAAWRIYDEDFLKSFSFLSDMKLRASYGSTGNQNLTGAANVNNFLYAGLYGAGNSYLQTPGIAPIQLANDHLKWETTDQFDAGIDFSLFNKLNITFDYYAKLTRDLIVTRPISGISGVNNATYSQNIGNLENKGIELVISATPMASKDFTWKSDFNIAFNRNKVTKLATDVLPYATGFASWVQEGQPLGTFRGYKVDRLFQQTDDIAGLNAASPTGVFQSSLTRPGDIKFQDLDGNGVVNSLDQTILGSAQPKFIGGFTNSFSYKNFDLSIFAQFVSGNKIYNNTRAFSEGMNGIFGQSTAVLNRWTPTNTTTNMPRAVYGDPNNNRRTSDRFLEDGSYLRIKSVVLGYNVPASVLQRLHVDRLRIYASAQNLLTFTKYSGLDPEVNTFSGSNTSLGTDFLTYPQARTITFGVNLGF